jgi:hypothetical protein
MGGRRLQRCKHSELVGRAADTKGPEFQNMGVDHCGGDVCVAEEFLDGPDVLPVLEKVRCERMALMPSSALAPLCRVPDYVESHYAEFRIMWSRAGQVMGSGVNPENLWQADQFVSA